jgi:CRP-like cAMP-binding protein
MVFTVVLFTGRLHNRAFAPVFIHIALSLMTATFTNYLATRYRIPVDTAERIISLLVPRRVAKGTVLLKQGDQCTHAFFVVRGCLRNYVTDAKGKTHILSFAPEQWVTGDQISISHAEPSMFSIDAVEDSELFLADRNFFDRVSSIYEPFHRKCIQHLLEHMRAMEKRILYLVGAYGDERYLDFVNAYPELALRLPQYMIASYLGLSRQSLSRIRSKLAQP